MLMFSKFFVPSTEVSLSYIYLLVDLHDLHAMDRPYDSISNTDSVPPILTWRCKSYVGSPRLVFAVYTLRRSRREPIEHGSAPIGMAITVGRRQQVGLAPDSCSIALPQTIPSMITLVNRELAGCAEERVDGDSHLTKTGHFNRGIRVYHHCKSTPMLQAEPVERR